MAKSRYRKKSAGVGMRLIVAILLIALTLGVVYAIVGGIKNEYNPVNWFTQEVESKTEEPEEMLAPSANMEIEQTVERGITLLSAPMRLARMATYSLPATVDNVQTLTATISPAETSLQKVDYSIAWKTPSSSWASGKNIEDYIVIDQETDGDLTCAVGVLQPFAEQAIISCTARPLEEGDSVPSATCTVDYYKRVTGVQSLSFDYHQTDDEGEGSWNDGTWNVKTQPLTYFGASGDNWYFSINVTYSYGIGTKSVGLGATNARVSLANDIRATIQNIVSPFQLRDSLMDSPYVMFETMFGPSVMSSSSKKSQLYNAFNQWYNQGKNAFVMTVTTSYSGSNLSENLRNTDVSFEIPFKFNPTALGIKAAGLSLDKNNLGF